MRSLKELDNFLYEHEWFKYSPGVKNQEMNAEGGDA